MTRSPLSGAAEWFRSSRYDAVNGQRQALGGRQFRIGQLRVTRIVARITFVIFGQFRRGDGKAATPLFNLLVAILLSGFGFVQALQRAVVTFVQFSRISQPAARPDPVRPARSTGCGWRVSARRYKQNQAEAFFLQ